MPAEATRVGKAIQTADHQLFSPHYTELLEWEKEPITEPPLTTDLTDAAEIQGIGT